MNPTIEYVKFCAAAFGDSLSMPAFILRHAREFKPRIPHSFRGTMKECYRNAFELMQSDPSLMYCEGYATGAIVPVLHAWCINSNGEVIDPTWKPGQGKDYFGVVFKREFVLPFVLRKTSYGVLDDMDNDFPVVTGKIPVEEWKAQ